MFTLLVAGSRSYENYEEFVVIMDKVLAKQEEVQIICGGARGADHMAEVYAATRHIPIKVFPADWKKYGKSAGYRRNEEMHKFLSRFKNRGCILFWDMQSPGTKHNIPLCEAARTPLRIFNINTHQLLKKGE